MQHNYESIKTSLEAANKADSDIIKALVQDIDQAFSQHVTDQALTKYYVLLINLEIMSQGAMGTKMGSHQLSAQTTALIQDILSHQVDRKDHQFAYLCYRAKHLGLISNDNAAEYVRNLKAIIDSGRDLNLLMTVFKKTIPKKASQELQNETSTERRASLQEFLECADNFGELEFDPLLQPNRKDASFAFERFVPNSQVKCDEYAESLRTFDKLISSTKVPKEMKSSINEALNAASYFYRHADVSDLNKTNCKNLLKSMSALLNQASEFYDPAQGKNLKSAELRKLLDLAHNIVKNVDKLEGVSPRQDLHWKRIIIATFATLLVGLLVWIIPSITCCGRNSFFRHEPLVTELRGIINKIQDDIVTKLRELRVKPVVEKPLPPRLEECSQTHSKDLGYN